MLRPIIFFENFHYLYTSSKIEIFGKQPIKEILTYLFQEERKESLLPTFSEAAIAAKSEIPDELLLLKRADTDLQIVAADTSTEDEQSAVNRSGSSILIINNKRTGRGRGRSRGRGRRGKASTPLRLIEVHTIFLWK